MKLKFIGADHEVTGSAHLIEVGDKKILVDYGMEQGKNLYENVSLPYPESEIDYLFVTHAHMDHTGLIPLLYKNGFRGKIFAQIATCDLAVIMLKDSAHIQEFEAEWRNRKAKRSGAEEYTPLYTMDDALASLELFVPIEYNEKVKIDDNIEVRFVDAGHLLGSASIEMWLTEGSETKKIVFSGDIGNSDQPIINDPTYINEADYVVMESTYGDRMHEKKFDYVPSLASILNETFKKGGNVVIPSFAVGRTQEILFFIRQIKEQGLVTPANFEVICDSPLAISATEIFDRHSADCYDAECQELIRSGIKPFIFDGLKTATTSEESMQINLNDNPKVIISASGMCDAGRIRHHLKHNLWREESTICFVGYQAVGTIGRKLIDGEKEVRMFGEDITVKANITTLPGMSGHADQGLLLKWIEAFDHNVKKVFVVHGEDSVTDTFAKIVEEKYGFESIAPYSGGEFDLTNNELISIGEKKPISTFADRTLRSGSKVKSNAFKVLLSSGNRLMSIIHKFAGLDNKRTLQFAKEVEAVCDKWDKELPE